MSSLKLTPPAKKTNPFVSKECIDILNFRIEQEEYSSRFYTAMSMWLNDKGYMGAAAVWAKDAQDELVHAQWAKDFLLDMGVTPKTPALKEPPQTFTGLPDIIRQSFAHEVLVTQQCNDLASHAMKYLTEQQEEMGKVQTLVDQLEAFGEDKIAMRLFDHELKG